MFIVIEGVDGCGKSTILKKAAEELSQLGLDVITTREPGGSNIQISEDIRDILLNKDYGDGVLSDECELLLMTAARAQHYDQLIRPKRNTSIILCDRYIGSTIAYQGYGRGLSIDRIKELNAPYIQSDTKADLTIVLTVSKEKAAERLNMRKDHKSDRLDKTDNVFKSKVEQGISELHLYEDILGEIKYISADHSIDDNTALVIDAIIKFLMKKG